VEVDYAGDPIEWFDLKTGEIHHAWVFVAVLGFSHLLYARATEDMQSRNWLGCHRRMFASYCGITHVLVPDCLKQGVLKCHLYDPDLKPRVCGPWCSLRHGHRPRPSGPSEG
jgi:transposase